MMMKMLRLIVVAALVGVSTTVEATSAQQWIGQRGEKIMSSSFLRASSASNTTMDPFAALKQKGPTQEFLEKERRERQARNKERKRAFREKVASWRPSEPEKLERVSQEQFNKMQGDRSLGWMSGSSGGSTYSSSLADPSQDYDMWAQAYRMLGGFIDCDHDKDDDDHNSGDNNNNGDDKSACSRWMMWAAYVNPNYQGNGYDEYFGDDAVGTLDCHSPDTEWQLIGVYRQEFYQFIEQISKHLWALDDYEYVVALAGLAYMTDYDCFYVGQINGNDVYGGVAPQPYGYFQMALYTDDYCLCPDDSLGVNFDDFGLQSDIDLGSKDDTDDDSYSWAYDWWYDTQEYTLTALNEVYNEYKYCTTCIDWPTYQDGYFIGDYGTDDDDLINQCWKFHSHDSFICGADCIAKGHAQGTILSITYGDTSFGKVSSSFYEESSSGSGSVESPMARLLANAFLTLSFLLFVATFLAFAVARRSRYRESKTSRSRRLLDDDEHRSRKSRRSSKSRAGEGDGLYRSSSRDRRSSRKSRSSSKSRKHRRSKSYEPPKESPRNGSTPPPPPADGFY